MSWKRFQLCGVHLPSYSHTASHTDPLRAKLQTVMSCLTAVCKNHRKQFYVQLTTAEGAQATRKTLSEAAHCKLEQAVFYATEASFTLFFTFLLRYWDSFSTLFHQAAVNIIFVNSHHSCPFGFLLAFLLINLQYAPFLL